MDDLEIEARLMTPEREARLAQLLSDHADQLPQRLNAEQLAHLKRRYNFWTNVQYGTVALGVLLLLIGAYGMRKHVPKQPHSGSAVVHTADDLEIGRHKHDGSQPTVDHARPGQHKTITWDARL